MGAPAPALRFQATKSSNRTGPKKKRCNQLESTNETPTQNVATNRRPCRRSWRDPPRWLWQTQKCCSTGLCSELSAIPSVKTELVTKTKNIVYRTHVEKLGKGRVVGPAAIEDAVQHASRHVNVDSALHRVLIGRLHKVKGESHNVPKCQGLGQLDLEHRQLRLQPPSSQRQQN